MKKPIIVIIGPTGSGKSALALRLSKQYNGQIIGADSMQIYQGLDICTAKPTQVDMQQIPHYMISIVERGQNFSVADYVENAKAAYETIVKTKALPILCGGTGLYIDRFLAGIPLSNAQKNMQYRIQIEKEDNQTLYNILAQIDPQTAYATHVNNRPRIIRALEIYHTTGQKKSILDKESQSVQSPYSPIFIGLFARREYLYEKINNRVEEMQKSGFVEEALLEYSKNKENTNTANAAIGYKELIPYFKGTISEKEAIEKIKQATRNYAKRQLTWFSKNKQITWFDIEKNEQDKIKLQKEEMLWTLNF